MNNDMKQRPIFFFKLISLLSQISTKKITSFFFKLDFISYFLITFSCFQFLILFFSKLQTVTSKK